MRGSRYSTSRQKACNQCSSAKARCDRRLVNKGRCSRCTQRGLQCSYTSQAGALENLSTSNSDIQVPSPSSLSHSCTGYNHEPLACNPNDSTQLPGTPGSNISRATIITGIPTIQENRSSPRSILLAEHDQDDIDFSNLEIDCPINADEIRNRWIQAYIPEPGQTVKIYPDGVSSFIHTILKSYSTAAVNGRRLVPFVHPTQISSKQQGSPLTTCLSLVRMCSNQVPGSESATASIIQRQMDSIFERRGQYNSETLFEAFQAFLIYTMVLFFRLEQSCRDSFRSIVTNLQEIACCTARQGLICAADRHRVRPRWEEWIVTEAKRRTIYVMYLLDGILSTRDGLPTFLATELRGLPAPASQLLWTAQVRYEWEREYNIHLAEWAEGSLTIDELWPTPDDLTTADVIRRSSRVDRWLENLDEYGTMMYAIMRCTHGE